MSEKQLNIKKIQEKICSVINESIATCILELIKDSYRAGLTQAEFDNNMSLIEENQDLKKQLKIKHDGFMASVEESCDLAKENEKLKKQNQKYKEVINNLKDKLMKYFEVGRNSYFYVLTRDKSAFDYGTMSFDDFKEFSEEQVDDIIDFLKEVE